MSTACANGELNGKLLQDQSCILRNTSDLRKGRAVAAENDVVVRGATSRACCVSSVTLTVLSSIT